MSCIICDAPVTDLTHKTYIIAKNTEGEAVRSVKPFPLCFDHYAAGDYQGLACRVIESAINDLCDEKLDDICQKGQHKQNLIGARRMEARGFLFGKGVKFWADVAGIPMPDLTTYVHKCLAEAKQGIVDAKVKTNAI